MHISRLSILKEFVVILYSFILDVAEWVLSKCALEETNDSDIVDFIDYDVGFETNEGKT